LQKDDGAWHERTWDKLDGIACHTDRPRGRKYYINTLLKFEDLSMATNNMQWCSIQISKER
jgi:hypothetical protein